MSTIRSIIKGCGSYLPERIMTNADMARFVETSDDWISERTGIRQRHIAADDEKTSDLAIKAAERALDMAGMAASDLDMIVLATATPDQTFPATATTVQHALGMHKGFAFDLQAVCSGFVYALNTADNFIKAGQVKRALVIGAETFTRILDYEDRTTCVLFGDGAGAVVLEAEQGADRGAGQPQDRGILASRLHSDGRYGDMLYVDGGPSSTGTTGHVRMKGREVFRHAVVNLAAVMEEILADVGLTSQDVDWVVPHQANRRILEGTAKKLNLSPDKVIMTVDRHANTSAASIPLALDEAVRDGRIKTGDLLMLEAMGGGFTWGGCLVRW
ncbi:MULTISPECIES: beta-ketoacyl-ACP synthase III [unclassified Iodidimonas]|uniref:beta-ketoacyl-ACP synthase III n=1 Tax=unclassified Iodidimonas TaxID=2626145 RepID=UPI0024824C2C|nr:MULTISPECIES: beta-ketoacyl-ACP synthase III [unclassified Iodidimonas]